MYKFDGCTDDFGFVSEGLDPVDVWFAAEPGELAFGIVAMALLGGGDGGLWSEFTGED